MKHLPYINPCTLESTIAMEVGPFGSYSKEPGGLCRIGFIFMNHFVLCCYV